MDTTHSDNVHTAQLDALLKELASGSTYHPEEEFIRTFVEGQRRKNPKALSDEQIYAQCLGHIISMGRVMYNQKLSRLNTQVSDGINEISNLNRWGILFEIAKHAMQEALLTLRVEKDIPSSILPVMEFRNSILNADSNKIEGLCKTYITDNTEESVPTDIEKALSNQISHLKDQLRRSYTTTLHRLMEDRELLSYAHIALTRNPPKTHVAVDHLERVLAAQFQKILDLEESIKLL